MTIYDVLKQDHNEVSGLFEQLMQTGNDAEKERERLFGTLKQELQAHTSAEEDIFYPLLENNTQTRDMATRAIKQHREVERLLKEMSSMSFDSSEWSDSCRKLYDKVEEHVDEEENRIFPQLEQILSDEEARKLGSEFKREEDQLLKKTA